MLNRFPNVLSIANLWAIGIVLFQWVALIVILRIRKRSDRRVITFVRSDLVFIGLFNAMMATFFGAVAFVSSDPIVSFLVLPLLVLFGWLLYVPGYVFLPIGWLARVKHGRPQMSSVELAFSTDLATSGLRLAHLSDLHLTADLTLENETPRHQVNEIVKTAITWAIEETEAVLLTGDITDQGRPEEWDQLFEIIDSVGESFEGGRFFLIPGNHDLSLVTHYEPGTLARFAYEQHAFTFISKALVRCPETWKMIVDGHLVSVRRYLNDVAEYLECYTRYPPYTRSSFVGGHAVLDIWFPKELVAAACQYPDRIWPTKYSKLCHDFLQLAYPMVMLDNEQFLVVGLNSCDESPESLLSSGIGRLGRAQINRFKSVKQLVGGRRLIVLIHHHIGIPSTVLSKLTQCRNRVEIRALALRDAYKFAQIISQIDGCVVFHGHKHIGYRATLGKAMIVSGASALYGDELGGVHNGSKYVIDQMHKIEILQDAHLRGQKSNERTSQNLDQDIPSNFGLTKRN